MSEEVKEKIKVSQSENEAVKSGHGKQKMKCGVPPPLELLRLCPKHSLINMFICLKTNRESHLCHAHCSLLTLINNFK